MITMSNKIFVIWGLVIVMLLGTLLILGNNKKDKVYMALEKDLDKATLVYLKNNNMVPELDESAIVFVSKLIEEDYIKESEDLKKYCIESITFTKGLIKDKYEITTNCKDEE